MTDNADWWKDPEDQDPQINFPPGWTKEHGKLFRMFRLELKQNPYVPERFIQFGGTDKSALILVVDYPFRKGKSDVYRGFLAAEIAGPSSFFVYDGGLSDIMLRLACKDKRFKAPKLNYEQWQELRTEDPFAEVESPVASGVLYLSDESPDLVASKLRRQINMACRMLSVTREVRRLRKKVKELQKEVGEGA